MHSGPLIFILLALCSGAVHAGEEFAEKSPRSVWNCASRWWNATMSTASLLSTRLTQSKRRLGSAASDAALPASPHLRRVVRGLSGHFRFRHFDGGRGRARCSSVHCPSAQSGRFRRIRDPNSQLSDRARRKDHARRHVLRYEGSTVLLNMLTGYRREERKWYG